MRQVQDRLVLVGGSGGKTPCSSEKASEHCLTHSETSNTDYDEIISECSHTFREHSEVPFKPVIEDVYFSYLGMFGMYMLTLRVCEKKKGWSVIAELIAETL